MSKKPLGKDAAGVQKVMRRGDYLGDALGQFSLNAISGLVGQLTYFYTDKVSMAAGAVATAFLFTKILDAFTDLIMGNIVDHTKPGKERYRPWLLRMALPAALLCVLLFTVPRNVSSGVQIIYMFITNFLLTAVIYTAICVPFNALMVVRTSSQEERGRMGTWRAAAGYVAGMVIVMAIIPITNMLGGDQAAWIKFGAILAVLLLICLLICYKTSKEVNPAEAEKQQDEDEEAVPFSEALRNLLHNKYWFLVLIMNLCVNVAYGLSNTSGTYYCKWIYGNDNLTAILGGVGLIPTVLGFATVGILIKKLGITKTLKVSFVIGLAANLLKLLNPTHFWYTTIVGCFATYANIPMMCLMGVMTVMTIDYNEYKYGKRMVACSQSASSFGGKVGNGVGSALVGWCLAIANYDASMEVLTAASRQAIYAFSIYIPAILYAIMLFCVMRFDLEAKLPEIQAENSKRKKK